MPYDFTSAEQLRYSRHFVLPGFGSEGQAKLKAAKVAVVKRGLAEEVQQAKATLAAEADRLAEQIAGAVLAGRVQ